MKTLKCWVCGDAADIIIVQKTTTVQMEGVSPRGVAFLESRGVPPDREARMGVCLDCAEKAGDTIKRRGGTLEKLIKSEVQN